MRPPKFFSQRSLRTQIVLVFGLLLVALAGVLSLALGEMLKQRIQQDVAESLHVVASNAAKMLADGLFDGSREIQVLADSRTLWRDGLDSEAVKQALTRSHATRPHAAWIGVADAGGTVRAAANDLLLNQDVRERPWFAGAQKGLFVGDVHPAKLLASQLPPSSTGEPLRFVDFAAPVLAGDKLQGVLGLHGSWDWADEVLRAMLPLNAAERRQAAFIFDRAGSIIYAPGGETEKLRAAGQQLPFRPSAAERSSEALARVLPWQDGQHYLTAAVQMQARNLESDLGWYVVVRQPVEQAFAQAQAAVAKAAAIAIALALLATLLAVLAARRLSMDLRAITEAVEGVNAGGARAELPVYGSSHEVEALSSALQDMTRRLLGAHEEMEAQVRERTRELEAANRELDLLARSDPLTGLLNRRGFGSHLKAAMALALRSGRPLSLVMLDVDHFKRINDTFGHDIGDEVLRYLGQLLPQRLRETDVVARLGGEEFVLMLPDTDATGARRIAETLNQMVAAHEGPVYGKFTISAGVATSVPGMSDSALLLRHADEALYRAKGEGRNRVCVADTAEASPA